MSSRMAYVLLWTGVTVILGLIGVGVWAALNAPSCTGVVITTTGSHTHVTPYECPSILGASP